MDVLPLGDVHALFFMRKRIILQGRLQHSRFVQHAIEPLPLKRYSAVPPAFAMRTGRPADSPGKRLSVLLPDLQNRRASSGRDLRLKLYKKPGAIRFCNCFCRAKLDFAVQNLILCLPKGRFDKNSAFQPFFMKCSHYAMRIRIA